MGNSGVKDGGDTRVKRNRCLTGVGLKDGWHLLATGRLIFTASTEQVEQEEDIA